MRHASNHTAAVPAVPILPVPTVHAPILATIVRLVAGFALLMLAVTLIAAMLAGATCVASGVAGVAAGGLSRWFWHEAKQSRRRRQTSA